MMKTFVSFLCGFIFGFGLIVAGMTNPIKVLAFLDLAGPWDPSLAFVMIGAIAATIVFYTWNKQRQLSYLGEAIQLPQSTHIDRALVIGNILFGIGWGLAGICPGPAWVLLGTGATQGIIFILSMLVGMGLFEYKHVLCQWCGCKRFVSI